MITHAASYVAWIDADHLDHDHLMEVEPTYVGMWHETIACLTGLKRNGARTSRQLRSEHSQ